MLLLLLLPPLLLLPQGIVCQPTNDGDEPSSDACVIDGDQRCRGVRPVAAPCSVLPVEADTDVDRASSRAIRAEHLTDAGETIPGHAMRLDYYLLGSPIAHSPSPLLHNAGFAACGLRHVYQSKETPSVEEVAPVLRNRSFGGASVTIPLKEAIIPLLDRLGTEAQAIGAVNTIVRTSGNELVGENTDYLGIMYPVKAALQRRRSRQDSSKTGIALVVGAGGTARAAAFAARELGLGVFILNRDPQKAAKVAADFKGTAVPCPIIMLECLLTLYVS